MFLAYIIYLCFLNLVSQPDERFCVVGTSTRTSSGKLARFYCSEMAVVSSTDAGNTRGFFGADSLEEQGASLTFEIVVTRAMQQNCQGLQKQPFFRIFPWKP